MKAKIIILMILIVLFTVFVSQNTEVITIDAFFWQFRMSTIVLISLVGLLGVVIGFIIAKLFDRPSPAKSTLPKEDKTTINSR
ncbi:MAG TPA: LapA family protein [Ignavibacteriaceae bacterium]